MRRLLRKEPGMWGEYSVTMILTMIAKEAERLILVLRWRMQGEVNENTGDLS